MTMNMTAESTLLKRDSAEMQAMEAPPMKKQRSEEYMTAVDQSHFKIVSLLQDATAQSNASKDEPEMADRAAARWMALNTRQRQAHLRTAHVGVARFLQQRNLWQSALGALERHYTTMVEAEERNFQEENNCAFSDDGDVESTTTASPTSSSSTAEEASTTTESPEHSLETAKPHCVSTDSLPSLVSSDTTSGMFLPAEAVPLTTQDGVVVDTLEAVVEVTQTPTYEFTVPNPLAIIIPDSIPSNNTTPAAPETTTTTAPSTPNPLDSTMMDAVITPEAVAVTTTMSLEAADIARIVEEEVDTLGLPEIFGNDNDVDLAEFDAFLQQQEQHQQQATILA